MKRFARRPGILFLIAVLLLCGAFSGNVQAQALGWQGESLLEYAKFGCIGGDVYSNYEKKLETADGRIYYECDVDTLGALSRGAKRLVYSNDGLIYYTGDHYNTFERIDK